MARISRTIGTARSAYKILAGKLVDRPLGNQRREVRTKLSFHGTS
jgi:hypothetical protein